AATGSRQALQPSIRRPDHGAGRCHRGLAARSVDVSQSARFVQGLPAGSQGRPAGSDGQLARVCRGADGRGAARAGHGHLLVSGRVTMKPDYDVLIIGWGASGGMAAYTPPQKVVRCLMLDAGPPLDFEQARTLKAVYDLPYRGFGKPGRFPHVTQASEFDASL